MARRSLKLVAAVVYGLILITEATKMNVLLLMFEDLQLDLPSYGNLVGYSSEYRALGSERADL